MLFIDSHAHLHANEKACAFLLETMRQTEISSAIVVAGGVVTPEELARNFSTGEGCNRDAPNRKILELAENSAGKLFPFYFANPYSAPIEYLQVGNSFYGLKFAPLVHGIPFFDSRIAAYLNEAVKFRHPVYLHCLPRKGFQVSDVVELAKKFPSLIFMLGHGGIGHCDFAGVNLIAPYPNIYFEISGCFTSVVKFAIEILGEERVLFGTEHPLQDMRLEMAKAKILELPATVMGKNVARLIGVEVGNA